MPKNNEYWKKRMEELEEEAYQKSKAYYEDVKEQFEKAERSIQADIEKWYYRLAENNEISYSEAKKLLKKAELEEFKWTVEEYIRKGEENAVNQQWMKELENASARYHINYLESMKLQLQQYAEMLFTEFEHGMTDFLKQTFTEQLYYTAFEISKGIGVGINVAKINEAAIDMMIKKPWAQDGKAFSDRIWQNKEKLIRELHTELTQNIIRGESPGKAISSLAKKMNVSKAQAGRLIMTESAAISSKARKECFDDLDVERYQFVGTLDGKTCELCGSMDGKVFQMTDYEVGVTASPIHPNCRCSTAPYYDDGEEFGINPERIARDPATGKTYKVPVGMDYETWSKKYIQKGLSAVDMTLSEIPEHNKPIEIGNVDFADKDMVLSKLEEYENKIVNSPIENAVVISKEGTIRQCFGNLNGVYPDSDIGDDLLGAYVTHNHPIGSANEYSFSKADINLFMDNNLEVLRGIDEKYIYELTRNPEDIDEHMSIFELGENDARHSAVIIEAEKLGIGYRRYLRE